MKQRTTTAILTAALLLTAFCSSCGGTETGPAENTKADDTVLTEAQTEDTSYHADYLPVVDYGGYTYRIIGYDEYPADAETETGNIIDDAIYKRNRLIEERYNITIQETRYPYAQTTKVNGLMKQSGMAQSDDADLYNLVFPDAYSGLLAGYIPPASYLPVIDVSQPWYYHAMNDGMNIGGVQLLAYTAFDRTPGGSCLLFNKKLFNDLDLDSPYGLVDSGKWTYDVFYETAKTGISDVDGDGKMTIDDRFGLIAPADDITDFAYYGTGRKLVGFGADGIPFVSQDEALFDLYTKASDAVGTEGFFLNINTVKGADGTTYKAYQLFEQEHGLFAIVRTSALTQLGGMTDDYGVLPYPKQDESQKMYYTAPDGSRIMVPLACSEDLERVCVIKEALAVESLNINYPAYYEVSLKNRYVRDEDSVRMIDILTSGVTYDVGCAMDYNAIRGPWLNCIQSGNKDFVSAVTKNLSKANAVIDKLMENIELIKEIYG